MINFKFQYHWAPLSSLIPARDPTSLKLTNPALLSFATSEGVMVAFFIQSVQDLSVFEMPLSIDVNVAFPQIFIRLNMRMPLKGKPIIIWFHQCQQIKDDIFSKGKEVDFQLNM